MHHTAAQQNAVHFAVEHGRHGTDAFLNLVDHRIPKHIGIPVSFFCPFGQLQGVGNACVADEPSVSGAQLFHVRYFQIIVPDIGQQVGHRHASAAGGGHGAFAAYDVVPVHHPALPVGGNGNPPADVADHVIALFIFFVEYGFAVADGGFLQVQRVKVDDPVYPFDACHPGQVLQFIHIRRVDDHRFGPVCFRKFMGKLRP